MKKKILLLSLITAFASTAYASDGNLYPETGIITNIDYADSGCLLEITVANGNQFTYYSEDFDWFENDIVSMLMDSIGTETVEDDDILMLHYSGVIEDYIERRKENDTSKN